MSAAAAPGGFRQYTVFTLAAMGVLLLGVDSSIVTVAIPTMVEDLQTSLALVVWSINASALTQVMVMPLAGRLTETFGRLRVFVVCMGLFTLGNFVSGLAPDIYTLIAFRAMQGIGAGGILPAAVGIVVQHYPQNRDRLIGIFSTIFPLSSLIAPNLGGVLVEFTSWRNVFLVNVPFGLVIFLMLLGRARQEASGVRRKVDVVGAALFGVALGALLGALTEIGTNPSAWQTPGFWLMVAASVAFLVLFGLHERRTPEPMVDLDLVFKVPFAPINLYNLIYGTCVFGFFAFVPYFAVVHYGMSATQSGLILTPRALTAIFASAVVALFVMRLGYRVPLILGLVFLSISLFISAQGWGVINLGPLELSPFWIMGLSMVIAGLGTGIGGPASNNAALDLLPEKAALISGLRGVFRTVGGAIGSALMVVAVGFSSDPSVGLRTTFVIFGVCLLLCIPLIMLVPDKARERRKAGREQASSSSTQNVTSHPESPAQAPASARTTAGR